MSVPESFDALNERRVSGLYLEEFGHAIRCEIANTQEEIRTSEVARIAGHDARLIQIYEYVLENMAQSGAKGLSIDRLEKIFARHDASANSEWVPVEVDETGVTSTLAGDTGAGLALFHAKTNCVGALQECLALQDGWHRQLISFILRGHRNIVEENFAEFANPQEKAFQPPFSITGGPYSLSRHEATDLARTYADTLARYAKRPGRQAEDIFDADTLYQQDYGANPTVGMSDIFILARALANRAILEERCQISEPRHNVNDVVASIAEGYGLPIPPAVPVTPAAVRNKKQIEEEPGTGLA